jgi:hypothetical protein
MQWNQLIKCSPQTYDQLDKFVACMELEGYCSLHPVRYSEAHESNRSPISWYISVPRFPKLSGNPDEHSVCHACYMLLFQATRFHRRDNW